MTTLKENLGRITKSLETQEWVTCPLCGEEWNRLHRSDFYEYGKLVTTHCCVSCAEGVKSFQKIMNLYPANKPFSNWPDDWLRIEYQKRNGHDFLYLSISLGGDIFLKYLILKDSMGLSVYDDKEKVKVGFYPNAFQAWSVLKAKIWGWSESYGKAKEKVEKSWSKKI